MCLIRTQVAGSANHQDRPGQGQTEAAGFGPGPVVRLALGISGGPDRKAVQAYQASLETGAPLSERKPPSSRGKSRRWARKIITHVRESATSADLERSNELHAAVP